jgi:hypothetical protein
MKIFSIVSILCILALPGISQPDSAIYYASSRLDYYTNEEVGEVLVFVPENLKEHKITIDIVFEYERINRAYPVASLGISTVPFPMKLLREGANELTVSFYEDDKWVDSRKVWVTIKAHRDNAVKIDQATGGLSVAGMPLMPFGFFTNSPVPLTLLEEEVVKGFNLITARQDNGKKTLKSRKAYMNRCADLGIRVNYDISTIEKQEDLRREIELFRDHPALLTWFIADRPDGNELPADSLIEIYRLIKELDPYHPVSLLLMSPRKAGEYRDVMDIAMTNPNPVPMGRLMEVKDYTDIMKKAFWLQKPVWVVPQSSGGNEWWQREPTPREIRAMTYMAIIHGATGVQYFSRSGPNSFPKSTATWDECGKMALEIAALTPDILSAQYAPILKPDRPEIHAKAWNRSGLVTIAVVNEINEPGIFSLKMVDHDITIKANVLFENRQVDIVDGVIEDMIDGYGTRVYRFDIRRNIDLKRGFAPGNLSVDPGFEDISTTGVPAACYAYNGYDKGSTYFVDSRKHYQGDHSLRLNNPSDKPGNRLSFFGLDLAGNKSYTISIMARTGSSSNKPGGKKGGAPEFRLGMGQAEKVFECTDTWQKYEIHAVRGSEGKKVSPQLEMAGKGTAWFDLLQVYPDMDLVESRGEAGKGSIVELKSVHSDVKIFYTTDGSDPTPESLPYLIPLEVDSKAMLKAAAYKDGIRVGYIERQ